MRAVLQRVIKSDVTVDSKIVGDINRGLVVLLGIEEDDTELDVAYMTDKIPKLRLFEDAESKMNLSLVDVGGELMIISQFTLYGDCRKGRRPGFTRAARPEKANILYEQVIEGCMNQGIKVSKGIFQADMLVCIYNDGPVTLLLDSKRAF